jgi:2'-5' RNA ligase
MKEGLTEMAKIRTFICIELPDEIRQGLANIQSQLQQHGANVRWVRPKSIHLTLKFLGDVDEGNLHDIVNATQNASKDTPPFSIGVRQAGLFPNLRRPRVLWVSVDESTGELKRLHKRLEDELVQLGYPKETRTFSPHLTIGRVKSLHRIEKVTQELRTSTFEAGCFKATEVVVMKSDLKPSGAVYTALQRIQLFES